MEKKDIPQDLSALGKITNELCYAVDENGNYSPELSKGWEVKITALDAAWKDIGERVEAARQRVMKGEASPLLFFMELRLMDIPIVAGYTGFWKFQVRNHLKPSAFAKLPEKKLARYASVFDVSVEQLKTMNPHEG